MSALMRSLSDGNIEERDEEGISGFFFALSVTCIFGLEQIAVTVQAELTPAFFLP
jgi:hypothetical protein